MSVLKYVCPKCAQDDKGFSRQCIVAQPVSNTGAIGVPEELDGSVMLFCEAAECLYSGLPSEFEVQTGSARGG
jgi:hypothetical protein